MKVAVFHPGTQHSWQTALALQQLGLLEWYATSIFYQPERWPYRLERYLPGPLARRLGDELRRFSHAGLDPQLVRSAGAAEWLERIAGRLGFAGLARRLDSWGNRRFVGLLADEIGSGRPFALWGYDSSSLESFRLARAHGRPCILDRTIGDFRAFNRIMREIAERDAAWFPPGEVAASAAQIERSEAEYAAADVILTGCEFAAESIASNATDPSVAARLKVLPYCYDEALFGALPPPRPRSASEPVRFLFAGLLIPRKGVQHVLEAIARIPRSAARLTLVGQLGVPRETFARFADRVEYLPHVPRTDMPQIMARHDVLVLPSYFEGAGIVLYEGLAAGLSLIQSRNCALAVSPGTGILLDELSTDAVHAAMLQAIEDRSRLEGWRAAAQARARQFSFAHYREGVGQVVAGLAR